MPITAGPVIDTHHHIWRRADVPWLRDPPIRRAIGDFFGLRRDIPVEEWMHDVTPQGVVKSVHVTANWGPARALDETRWLQVGCRPARLSARHRVPGRSRRSRHRSAAQGAEAVSQHARRAPPAPLGFRAAAPERQPSRSVQHAGVPPRLRAPGRSSTCISSCRCSPRRRPTRSN